MYNYNNITYMYTCIILLLLLLLLLLLGNWQETHQEWLAQVASADVTRNSPTNHSPLKKIPKPRPLVLTPNHTPNKPAVSTINKQHHNIEQLYNEEKTKYYNNSQDCQVRPIGCNNKCIYMYIHVYMYNIIIIIVVCVVYVKVVITFVRNENEHSNNCIVTESYQIQSHNDLIYYLSIVYVEFILISVANVNVSFRINMNILWTAKVLRITVDKFAIFSKD